MQFTLRPFEEGDAFTLSNAANNEKIARFLREGFPLPYRPSDAKAYIADIKKKGELHQLIRAIVIKGEAAGSIGVFRKDQSFSRTAEIGYFLAEQYWGNGIATEAVRRMVKLAFERFDIVRIQAEVFAPNKASMRVLEKAGFVFEGVLHQSVYRSGEILDAHMWATFRDRSLLRRLSAEGQSGEPTLKQ